MSDDNKKKKPGLRLARGKDGDLKILKGASPTLGMDVEVIPLTYGQSKHFESFGESLLEWSDEEKLQLINENVVAVDGEQIGEITMEEMMNDFDPWTVNDLLQAVVLYSGMGRLYGMEFDEDDEEAEAETVGKL